MITKEYKAHMTEMSEYDQKNFLHCFSSKSFCNYFSDICVNVLFTLKMAEQGEEKKRLPQEHQLMRGVGGEKGFILDTFAVFQHSHHLERCFCNDCD